MKNREEDADATVGERSPHSVALRKGRFSEAGRCYAITKCVLGRRPMLVEKLKDGRAAASLLADAVRYRHQVGICQCFGLVVMPDHFHLVIQLLQNELPVFVASLSKFTSRQISSGLRDSGPLWQSGFYEHALRGERGLQAYLAYMNLNPVRAGLVSRPEEWPWTFILPRWPLKGSPAAGWIG